MLAAIRRLDVLVNAAGYHQMRHTTEVTDEQWAYDLAVNLSAVLPLPCGVALHLLDGSNIVNGSPRWPGWRARSIRPVTARPSTDWSV